MRASSKEVSEACRFT